MFGCVFVGFLPLLHIFRLITFVYIFVSFLNVLLVGVMELSFHLQSVLVLGGVEPLVNYIRTLWPWFQSICRLYIAVLL